MKKNTKRAMGAVLWFLAGLVVWELIPAYCYFALPIWGLEALWGLHIGLCRLQKRKSGLAKGLRGAVCVILAVCLVFFCVVEGKIVRGSRGAEENDCPYLLCLGAAVKGDGPSRSLRERLEAAKAYLQAHPQAVCIVSGGQGWNESMTEAECMFRWLTDQGIAPERVWMEDKATSTWENLCFTLDLIEAKTGTRPETLAVVSSEYHLYRAGLMAQDLGIAFLGVPGVTHPWLNRIHYYFREFFGVVHYWVLGN